MPPLKGRLRVAVRSSIRPGPHGTLIVLKGRVEGLGADADLGSFWVVIGCVRQRCRREAVNIDDQAVALKGQRGIHGASEGLMVWVIPFLHQLGSLDQIVST